jgi:exopolyphosphatase/guanosine-5'-triphosphate,3'-diphosphate pyrophosphatase
VPEPGRYAVISVGTNSCRLLLASGEPDALRIDYQETRGTRIGQGVNETGRLAPEAVERTLAAVHEYASVSAGCTGVFGIGTSALRDAADGAEFRERFALTAGVPLDILTGEEEAACSFEGAVCGLRASGITVPSPLTVVDVGGGSTEFATRRAPTAAPSLASLQIGAVRLTEKHLTSDPPTVAQIDGCRVAIRAALATLSPEVRPHGSVVAVGGTANTAARMLQLIDDRARGAVASVPAADLRVLLKATLALPVRDRLRLRGLPPQRADIFPAGLMILDEIVEASGAAALIVSESDLLLGYVSRAVRRDA